MRLHRTIERTHVATPIVRMANQNAAFVVLVTEDST